MTKKILTLLLVLVMCLSVCGMVACSDTTGSDPDTDNSETGEGDDNSTSTAYDNMIANMTADKQVDSILYTYVGSYVTINTMGVVRAAHLINLFDDGTVEIYMGFFNDGMGGSLQEYYIGTYLIEGTTLTIDYLSTGNNEQERQLVAEVTYGQFAGKLWMGASLSTYDVVYYSVDVTSVANANEIYIGTTADDSSYVANVLAVYHGAEGSYPEDEGMFALVMATNSFVGSISGDYTKLWAGLDSDDMLELVYGDYALSNGIISGTLASDNAVTDTVNYSNNCVIATSFVVDSSAYDNTLVKVK